MTQKSNDLEKTIKCIECSHPISEIEKLDRFDSETGKYFCNSGCKEKYKIKNFGDNYIGEKSIISF